MKRLSRTLLTRYRAAHGLTQAQLGERLGVARNTVNRWEMGLHPVPKWVGTLLFEVLEPRQPKRGGAIRSALIVVCLAVLPGCVVPAKHAEDTYYCLKVWSPDPPDNPRGPLLGEEEGGKHVSIQQGR